jgi:hypothetical protein
LIFTQISIVKIVAGQTRCGVLRPENDRGNVRDENQQDFRLENKQKTRVWKHQNKFRVCCVCFDRFNKFKATTKTMALLQTQSFRNKTKHVSTKEWTISLHVLIFTQIHRQNCSGTNHLPVFSGENSIFVDSFAFVSYDKSINVYLYLVQYEIYFSRHFIFYLFALALRARANNNENKMTRKINLILHSEVYVNIYLLCAKLEHALYKK